MSILVVRGFNSRPPEDDPDSKHPIIGDLEEAFDGETVEDCSIFHRAFHIGRPRQIAHKLQNGVASLLDATEQEVRILAHSAGGLWSKLALKDIDTRGRVKLVTVATPHRHPYFRLFGVPKTCEELVQTIGSRMDLFVPNLISGVSGVPHTRISVARLPGVKDHRALTEEQIYRDKVIEVLKEVWQPNDV